MGFIRDIRRIIALLPGKRQNLLFSATFSKEIRDLAAGMLNDPASVQIAARNTAAALVSQVVHPVDRDRKRELLSHLVRHHVIEQALVFTRTKHGANRLAEQLERDGIATAAIHGNKSQPQRVRALADFKAGRTTLLIATEVAARGLDIDALPHVVNYEMPMVPSDYVHRIGRTGRAGMTGKAISLVCVDEQKLLRDVERLLGTSIRAEVVAGFEPSGNELPQPIRLRSGQAGGAQPNRGAAHGRRQAPGQPRRADQYPPRGAEQQPTRSGRKPARPAARQGASIGRSWTSLPGEHRQRDEHRARDGHRSGGRSR
jgi:ATP-dependent RNA helicase RhlE